VGLIRLRGHKLKLIKMKNRILSVLVLVMLFISGSLSAQSGVGIKLSAGKINAKETTSPISSDGMTISHNLSYQSHAPYTNLGVYAHRRFEFLFVQSELSYSQFTTSYEVRSNIDDVNPVTEIEEKQKSIELQVIGGVQINNIRIGVGPVFRKSVGFDSPLSEFEFYEENKKSISGGFQLMAGYDFGLLNIQLKYEDMFNKVGEHIYSGSSKTKLNSNMSLISLGIGIEI